MFTWQLYRNCSMGVAPPTVNLQVLSLLRHQIVHIPSESGTQAWPLLITRHMGGVTGTYLCL